jgi:hypothetical protein
MPLREKPPEDEQVGNENEYRKSDCLAHLPHVSVPSIRLLHVEIARSMMEVASNSRFFPYLNFLYKLI